MKVNVKKLWPLGALSLIGASSLLSAADEPRMRNLENRMTALENRKNGSCVINPSARPYAKECWGFYVTADALVWQGHEDGLPIGIVTSGSSSLLNPTAKSNIRNLDWDWSWGFRVALGVNLAHDGWDAILEWTRWTTSPSRSFSASSGTGIYPVPTVPARTFGQVVGAASAKLNLQLNILDLSNGRQFFVSKYLTLRPYAGFRALWNKQHIKYDFNDILLAGNILVPADAHNLNQHSNFWGFGIRGGLDTQWGLGCGWSVFANYAAAILYSHYSIDYDEFATVSSSGSSTLLLDVGDSYFSGKTTGDMQLGMRWDWLSCDECYHFGVDLGWEEHIFPVQNKFLNFTDDGQDGKTVDYSGDLATQGFFLKFRFDF